MTATTDVRYRPMYMYMYGCEWMFVYVCACFTLFCTVGDCVYIQFHCYTTTMRDHCLMVSYVLCITCL